ncbi:hypothetical protein LguiB_000373 [Lonicera macranthoides]
MSRPIQRIASSSVPGYVPSDGRCLPCTRVSGSIIKIASSSSCSDLNSFSHFKSISLKSASRSCTIIFCSNSGNYRRNPDSPRQNRPGFFPFHYNLNEDSDDLEESKHFSSKNRSVIASKYLYRSPPGPKDKEVIEKFREVQAQLQAKKIKPEEKIEDLPKPKKESNNAGSRHNVLRKYLVPQADRDSSKDIIGASNGTLKHEVQKRERLSASSLTSNFRPRSQPNDSHDEAVNSDEPEPGPMLLSRAIFEEISDDISDDETFESDEEDNEDDAEQEQNMIESRDLSAMKLTELRALARSQGIKGFSKLKKRELMELLSGGYV